MAIGALSEPIFQALLAHSQPQIQFVSLFTDAGILRRTPQDRRDRGVLPKSPFTTLLRQGSRVKGLDWVDNQLWNCL